MRMTVTGRRTEVSDTLKEYVDKKAGKLGRFYDRVQSVEVVFDVDSSVMWDHVLRGMGIDPSTLMATRGVH